MSLVHSSSVKTCIFACDRLLGNAGVVTTVKDTTRVTRMVTTANCSIDNCNNDNNNDTDLSIEMKTAALKQLVMLLAAVLTTLQKTSPIVSFLQR